LPILFFSPENYIYPTVFTFLLLCKIDNYFRDLSPNLHIAYRDNGYNNAFMLIKLYKTINTFILAYIGL